MLTISGYFYNVQIVFHWQSWKTLPVGIHRNWLVTSDLRLLKKHFQHWRKRQNLKQILSKLCRTFSQNILTVTDAATRCLLVNRKNTAGYRSIEQALCLTTYHRRHSNFCICWNSFHGSVALFVKTNGTILFS